MLNAVVTLTLAVQLLAAHSTDCAEKNTNWTTAFSWRSPTSYANTLHMNVNFDLQVSATDALSENNSSSGTDRFPIRYQLVHCSCSGITVLANSPSPSSISWRLGSTSPWIATQVVPDGNTNTLHTTAVALASNLAYVATSNGQLWRVDLTGTEPETKAGFARSQPLTKGNTTFAAGPIRNVSEIETNTNSSIGYTFNMATTNPSDERLIVGSYEDPVSGNSCLWGLTLITTSNNSSPWLTSFACRCDARGTNDGPVASATCLSPRGVAFTADGSVLYFIQSDGLIRQVVRGMVTISSFGTVGFRNAWFLATHPTLSDVLFVSVAGRNSTSAEQQLLLALFADDAPPMQLASIISAAPVSLAVNITSGAILFGGSVVPGLTNGSSLAKYRQLCCLHGPPLQPTPVVPTPALPGDTPQCQSGSQSLSSDALSNIPSGAVTPLNRLENMTVTQVVKDDDAVVMQFAYEWRRNTLYVAGLWNNRLSAYDVSRQQWRTSYFGREPSTVTLSSDCSELYFTEEVGALFKVPIDGSQFTHVAGNGLSEAVRSGFGLDSRFGTASRLATNGSLILLSQFQFSHSSGPNCILQFDTKSLLLTPFFADCTASGNRDGNNETALMDAGHAIRIWGPGNSILYLLQFRGQLRKITHGYMSTLFSINQLYATQAGDGSPHWMSAVNYADVLPHPVFEDTYFIARSSNMLIMVRAGVVTNFLIGGYDNDFRLGQLWESQVMQPLSLGYNYTDGSILLGTRLEGRILKICCLWNTTLMPRTTTDVPLTAVIAIVSHIPSSPSSSVSSTNPPATITSVAAAITSVPLQTTPAPSIVEASTISPGPAAPAALDSETSKSNLIWFIAVLIPGLLLVGAALWLMCRGNRCFTEFLLRRRTAAAARTAPDDNDTGGTDWSRRYTSQFLPMKDADAQRLASSRDMHTAMMRIPPQPGNPLRTLDGRRRSVLSVTRDVTVEECAEL